MTTKIKQRYQRTFEKGRPTNGWERGERITDVVDVKPGDVLIMVSHQFQAENLIRILPRETPAIGAGFNYQYIDCRTLERSDGEIMFCHDFIPTLPDNNEEFFRAIDRRSKRRRICKLPG